MGLNITAKQIAEKCLDKYWGKMSSGMFQIDGWDKGSPAHKYAIKWAKRRIRDLHKMSWSLIYKEFLVTLRQE